MKEEKKSQSGEQSFETVDITIGTNMFGRLSDIKNTPSHVLAEFVDNALQSYRENRNVLERISIGYQFQVDINFEWAEKKDLTVIHIRDNAAGIDGEHFNKAFQLAHTPDISTGLNEFGMGLKTAALWLGENWSLCTSALGETEKRTITFDLNEVIKNNLKILPIFRKHVERDTHFTEVFITNLTNNAPTQKSLQKIKTELASIYRKSLHSSEMVLRVNGEELSFVEPAVLVAPATKNPSGEAIAWRKSIDFTFDKYKAKGFIGILRDIDATKNGFVLLRRGRVIIGAESDMRYFPKSLCGSSGTFRYKRMFGELELEGFDVAFNKNDIKDRENLEALMEALKSEIHTKDFDLYNQAEDYRLDIRTKQVRKIVRAHENAQSKKNGQIISLHTTKQEDGSLTIQQPEALGPPFETDTTRKPIVINQFDDKFKVDSVQYQLNVLFIDSGKDLLWVDTSQRDENIVTCKINTKHPFFDAYFKNGIDSSAIALMKTMAMAKFTAKERGNDTTAEMFECFNDYIKQIKV